MWHSILIEISLFTDSTQNISQILPPPHVLQSSIGQPMPPMHHAPNEGANQPGQNPNQQAPPIGAYNHMQHQMPLPNSSHMQQQQAQVCT